MRLLEYVNCKDMHESFYCKMVSRQIFGYLISKYSCLRIKKEYMLVYPTDGGSEALLTDKPMDRHNHLLNPYTINFIHYFIYTLMNRYSDIRE